jgi:quinol monooxygenase YgiN
MKKFNVYVYYHLNPGTRDEFLNTIKKIKKAYKKAGCINFKVMQDYTNENMFMEVVTTTSFEDYQKIEDGISANSELTGLFQKLDDIIVGRRISSKHEYFKEIM